jgi:hypothetical protein
MMQFRPFGERGIDPCRRGIWANRSAGKKATGWTTVAHAVVGNGWRWTDDDRGFGGMGGEELLGGNGIRLIGMSFALVVGECIFSFGLDLG